MRTDPPIWHLGLEVPAGTAEAFETALEPFVPALSWRQADDDPARWWIEGWSESEPDRAGATAAVALTAKVLGLDVVPDLILRAEAPRDWLRENLESFEPMRFGRFFVHGSHFDGPVPRGTIAIEVDAATAFGTGRHATTAGCLLVLDALRDKTFRRPMDMGCGSGILAIAMAKVWERRVMAVDNDPEAVAVTAGNAAVNRIADRVRAVRSQGWRAASARAGGPYDLVCANILARPLKAMAHDLARAMSRGGVAILSGFLVEDERSVLNAHLGQNMRLMNRVHIDGWSTLVVGKR